jgi:hypothetical protein
MADNTRDLHDEYGRPIVVAAEVKEDVSEKLADSNGRTVKIAGG